MLSRVLRGGEGAESFQGPWLIGTQASDCKPMAQLAAERPLADNEQEVFELVRGALLELLP